jgi:hypothetical protein
MVLLAVMPQLASAQQASNKAVEMPKNGKKAKAPRGRLPAYYGQVVDDVQREKIYSIQKEYQPKIDELKAQLSQLLQERNEKILGVLSPEQQKKIQEARETAAKARRSSKKPTVKKQPEPKT